MAVHDPSDRASAASEGPDDRLSAGEGTPRWVKVLGAIALAVVVLLAVTQALGVGDHGPGRHGSGDDTGPGHRPPPGVEHEPSQP